MVNKELLKRITLNEDILVGKPTIRGMRISVEQILKFLSAGNSIEELFQEYPELEPDDIQAVWIYISLLLEDEKIYQIKNPYEFA